MQEVQDNQSKQIPCGGGMSLPCCSLAEVFLAALRGVHSGGTVFAGRVVLIAKFAVNQALATLAALQKLSVKVQQKDVNAR